MPASLESLPVELLLLIVALAIDRSPRDFAALRRTSRRLATQLGGGMISDVGTDELCPHFVA